MLCSQKTSGCQREAREDVRQVIQHCTVLMSVAGVEGVPTLFHMFQAFDVLASLAAMLYIGERNATAVICSRYKSLI